MEAKMTEKQFREKVRAAIGNPSWSVAETVLPILAEAGFTFAPEPVRLPERLGLDERGFIKPEGVIWLWENEDQRLAGHTAARDRYNAYPRLRQAAERLAVLITPSVQMVGGEIPELRSALADLRVALAKGPK